MASIERTAYPRFKRYYTLAQLQKTYTPTSAEIAFARSNTQGDKNFFNLIVLVKSFQRLGYFPNLDQIPQDITNYLRDYLKLSENIDLGYDKSRTLYRHKKEIRAYFQVTAFDKQARHLISEAVSSSALVMDNPADLINVAIEMLVKDRYELPGFNSLNRLVCRAIQFLKDNAHRRGSWLSGEVDLSFASKEWPKFVLSGQKDQIKISRRHFEVCVFSYLASELKSGDICVAGSQDYADYREQLLSWSDCLPLLDEYCDNLGWPNNSNDFVEHLKSWLEQTATKVDEGYPNNTQIVINEEGEPVLKRLKKKADNPSLKALESLIEERMPERNLIDILKNVDYWTNFTRHFGPLSGSEPKLERATERYLLTLFTYGCNLGPYQAARHMRGLATAHELSFVNRRHINLSKLNSALVDILNRYHVLELPTFWGKGTSAAADGTKYDLYEQNLLSEYHIRYGGYGGIAYHHVADSYVALFSHFIPCGTWEAVYIIDGLLKNSSLIQPKTLHADTQGQSTPVFALSYLLGIKLMPRIRNWKDLTFYRPDKNIIYQHIDSLFSDSINWKLIQIHWQDLFRVVLSISTGKISSAVLLRKLGNYSRKNRLYKAFRELGRVVRTVFLLEYISDAKLRRQIQAATNKVESYNGFSKWFCFGGDGIIANNDPEEQEKIIKYNTLVANAVIFQNTVDLTEILQQLKREGYLIDPEDIKSLSPYLTEHIKRFGDYWLDMNIFPKALDEMMALGV